MARILYARPLVEEIYAEAAGIVSSLGRRGIFPALALLKAGEDPGALAYERALARACARCGIETRGERLPASATQTELGAAAERLSNDGAVSGVILLSPLPRGIDADAVRAKIAPQKDVDGASPLSRAAVYSSDGGAFAPCTAEAAVRLLEYYKIDVARSRAAVVGRSLVVGRPAAMLLLARDATVTLCHSKTENLADICRSSDIIVSAAGRPGLIDARCARAGQTVIDCGVSVGSDGALLGDAVFGELEPVVGAITPVPGGVGAVTTAILAKHVIEAAERAVK